MKQTLLSFLLALLPLAVSAEAVEIDGIYYNLIPKGKIAEVTSNPNYYSGDIVIPDKVLTTDGIEYDVTSIGERAFYNCSYLTSVTISNSVTSIGISAFSGCSELISLTIPNRVTSIGNGAFSNCSGLTSLTIPNSVTSIANSAFSNCSGLTSLTIPNSVTSIGNYAFGDCSGLTSLTIPNSVTSIGDYAFDGCSGLTSFTIPNSITSIGYQAFRGCSGLTSLTIPNSITSIGREAFRGCSGLTSVTIPNSVTSIANSAFSNCSGLTSLTIPNSVTYIGYDAFIGCSGLTSVTIPNSVTCIGDYTFYGCSNLTTITIGADVYGVGIKAFANCPKLTDVYSYSLKLVGIVDYGEYYTASDAFDNSYIEYATLHVPAEAIEAYKSTAPWSSFGTIVALDGTAFYELAVTADNRGTVTFGESSVSGGTQTFNVKGGDDLQLTLTPNDGYRLASVTVNGTDRTADIAEGVLTISGVEADVTVNVSFITDGETAAVSIGPAGLATFCSVSDLDFTEVSGLEAFTATGFNRATGNVMLQRVTDVPAGTGLLLRGDEGSYEIPVKTSQNVYANLLVGVTEATTIAPTAGGYVNFILANDSNGAGFYTVSEEGPLAAGRAYLRLPAVVAGDSRALGISFIDDATAIGEALQLSEPTDGWYDLQGRRIDSRPTAKGIYISNGRKVVIR